MQLILSGHVDGLWAQADVGRAGAGIEPNVPLAGREVGHGREAAASHTTWSPRLTTGRAGGSFVTAQPLTGSLLDRSPDPARLVAVVGQERRPPT